MARGRTRNTRRIAGLCLTLERNAYVTPVTGGTQYAFPQWCSKEIEQRQLRSDPVFPLIENL
jgi:hypothetical protein